MSEIFRYKYKVTMVKFLLKRIYSTYLKFFVQDVEIHKAKMQGTLTISTSIHVLEHAAEDFISKEQNNPYIHTYKGITALKHWYCKMLLNRIQTAANQMTLIIFHFYHYYFHHCNSYNNFTVLKTNKNTLIPRYIL